MAQARRPQAGGRDTSSGGNPSAPNQVPGVFQNAVVQQLYGFDGLNYKDGPAHIDDQQQLWCDNLHPIARGKLRAMFDISTALYTVGGGLNIIGQPHFFTIGSLLYVAVALSDGSLKQVKYDSPFTVTQILPPATLGLEVDYTQWGSQFLIIVSELKNAYFIWDGTSLFKPGTVGPVVRINSGGIGYTTTVNIATLGGTGSGATFTSTVVDGSVATITVANPGTGWLSTDNPLVALLFDDAANIRSAYGHATLADGVIASAVLTNGGTGYTSFPSITLTDGGAGTGSGATVVVDSATGGVLTGLRVVDGGSGYGLLGVPTIAFAGGGGSGAAGYVTIANGVITGVSIDDGGNGYVGTPDVVFMCRTGVGAAGVAVLEGKTISGVTMTTGGNGYSGIAWVVFNAANGPAYATLNLMPFGVDGISVTTFLSRVWVSHKPASPLPSSILFTDAGDPANFGPPGGAFPLTEEYLRYKISHLIPNGSFLYVVGDSSIGYISGIQTSGNPAITTFQLTNIDTETGTPWRGSVATFNQSLILVNQFGIHQISGGAVKKISTQVDDLFNSDINNITNVFPSTAIGDLNGVHIFGVLLSVRDPTTNTVRRLVLMSDGRRWWTYSPSVTLLSIFTSEIDSNLVLWGHDSQRIYKLFQTPAAIPKKLRAKLYSAPGIVSQKHAMAVYILLQPTANTTFVVKPVTEAGLGNTITPGWPTFTASLGQAFGRSAAQGFGHLLGWEITSTSTDFTINELVFLDQEYDINLP